MAVSFCVWRKPEYPEKIAVSQFLIRAKLHVHLYGHKKKKQQQIPWVLLFSRYDVLLSPCCSINNGERNHYEVQHQEISQLCCETVQKKIWISLYSGRILHWKPSLFSLPLAPFSSHLTYVCLLDGINATFNNISVTSWWSILLVEETEEPGENSRPVASH